MFIEKFDRLRKDVQRIEDEMLARDKELAGIARDLADKDSLLKAKEKDLKHKEGAIAEAEKLLKTQAELDRVLDEQKEILSNITKRDLELSRKYNKKNALLAQKEAELNEKEDNLLALAKKLEEKERDMKERVITEMTEKLKMAEKL